MFITRSKVSENYTNLLRDMWFGIPFTSKCRGSSVGGCRGKRCLSGLVIREENVSPGIERPHKQLLVEGEYQLTLRLQNMEIQNSLVRKTAISGLKADFNRYLN